MRIRALAVAPLLFAVLASVLAGDEQDLTINLQGEDPTPAATRESSP
jgi:hypothetical protein